MDKIEMNKMRELDAKAERGESLTLEEMRYFNENLHKMCEELRKDYEKWQYHTYRFPRF